MIPNPMKPVAEWLLNTRPIKPAVSWLVDVMSSGFNDPRKWLVGLVAFYLLRITVVTVAGVFVYPIVGESITQSATIDNGGSFVAEEDGSHAVWVFVPERGKTIDIVMHIEANGHQVKLDSSPLMRGVRVPNISGYAQIIGTPDLNSGSTYNLTSTSAEHVDVRIYKQGFWRSASLFLIKNVTQNYWATGIMAFIVVFFLTRKWG